MITMTKNTNPMKIWLSIVLIFILKTQLSSIPIVYGQSLQDSAKTETKTLETTEKLRFKFDNRKWKQVDTIAQGNFSRVTYQPEIAEDENSLDNELFRYQRTVGLLIDPQQYYDQLIATYQKQSPHFYSRPIIQGENYIIFEWGIQQGSGTPQYTEIQKYMRGKTASHIIRYSRVNHPMTLSTKSDWIKRFQVASIEKPFSKQL